MPSKASFRRRLRRRRQLVVLAAPLGAALLALTLGGGGARASADPGTSVASYAALAGDEPSGLPIVALHRKWTPGSPAGPTWPAAAPAGARAWPIASSIRRLTLSTPALSAWIARDSAGGVCILLYDGAPVHGIAAVYMGCSPEGETGRGASVEVSEIPGRAGEVIAAGVVPDGVTDVSTPLVDGEVAYSRVDGNAWSRVSAQTAAPGAETTEIAGG
jgi:hypothetical protein